MQLSRIFRPLTGVHRVALFTFAVLILGGCSMLGKFVAGMMTTKTADISEAAVQVRFIRNLYTPETKTTEATYLPDLWKEGENLAVINFQKRSGIGFYEIDGSVSLNGEPLQHVANGHYGKFIAQPGKQTFSVQTANGQRAEFVVEPIPEIKIRSVNGKALGGEVNLNGDLTIELQNPAGTENTEVRVALLMDLMGTRSWGDVGVFRSQNRITIPAMAFNHMPGIDPNMGDSYLLVERFVVKPLVVRGVGASQIVSASWDCVPVTVSGSTDPVRGIAAVGKGGNGSMEYDASKPNAFLGRPFAAGKKLAVVSFTVRATHLKQARASSSSTTGYYGSYSVTSTTTSVTTRQFPKLPDAFWDKLVNDMYVDFEQTLKKNWNVDLVPIEVAMKSPSYKDLEPISDQITEVEVEKGYKGSKNLIPTTLGALIGSISSTFASDRIDARLIRELGVDGIIAVTVDLEMPWEEFSLSPRMSFRIAGPPNGYLMGPTIYAQGVVSGSGVPLDEARMQADATGEVLGKVVRKEELMAAFERAFNELKIKEADAGYDMIWKLK